MKKRLLTLLTLAALTVAHTGCQEGASVQETSSNGQFDPAAAGLGTHSVQYVVVGANGCVGSSGLCTTVDLTTGSGIGLDNGGNGVEVYPNPSNGLFTVVMDGLNGIVQLSVMDIRGREVASQSLTASGRTTHSIDLSGLCQWGLYTPNPERCWCKRHEAGEGVTANGTLKVKPHPQTVGLWFLCMASLKASPHQYRCATCGS